jgi:hypothetical protein
MINIETKSRGTLSIMSKNTTSSLAKLKHGKRNDENSANAVQ